MISTEQLARECAYKCVGVNNLALNNAVEKIVLQTINLAIAQERKGKCETCGASIYSGPPDCPTCGAPNCCQSCCKITSLERERDNFSRTLKAAMLLFEKQSKELDELKKEREKVCEWNHKPIMGFPYEGCNGLFYTNKESQKFNYCPECGHKIKAVK